MHKKLFLCKIFKKIILENIEFDIPTRSIYPVVFIYVDCRLNYFSLCKLISEEKLFTSHFSRSNNIPVADSRKFTLYNR